MTHALMQARCSNTSLRTAIAHALAAICAMQRCERNTFDTLSKADCRAQRGLRAQRSVGHIALIYSRCFETVLSALPHCALFVVSFFCSVGETPSQRGHRTISIHPCFHCHAASGRGRNACEYMCCHRIVALARRSDWKHSAAPRLRSALLQALFLRRMCMCMFVLYCRNMLPPPRCLLLSAPNNPRGQRTAQEVRHWLSDKHGLDLSIDTVRRAMKQMRLAPHHERIVPPTPHAAAATLHHFAVTHRRADLTQWAFEDESTIVLRHTGRIVWGARGGAQPERAGTMRASVQMLGIIWWGGHFFTRFTGYLNADTYLAHLRRALSARSPA